MHTHIHTHIHTHTHTHTTHTHTHTPLYRSRDLFESVVWAGTRNLRVAIAGETEKEAGDSISTGFDEMAVHDKSIVFERTQFKTWYVCLCVIM